MNIEKLLSKKLFLKKGVYLLSEDSKYKKQKQTNNIFSNKWIKYNKEKISEQNKSFKFQKEWYLKLYGFKDENSFSKYLKKQKIILDAGCGLGYKAKWFSDLSPKSNIIGIDYSDSVFAAKEKYKNIPNLFFMKGDISNLPFKKSTIDYVNCDQVIHHTENPQRTLIELSRILKRNKEVAIYVYAKKAIPRELLDNYFRENVENIKIDDIWKLSEQLTQLGKNLSQIKTKVNIPNIPLLSIKGGKMDLQRFIYWNFLKFQF